MPACEERLGNAGEMVIPWWMIGKWIGTGAWVIILGSALYGQELAWTELETTDEPPQAATAVKMVGRDTPGVPGEIRKLSDIAYAEVAFVSDAKGHGLVQYPSATSPWLLQAVDEGLRGHRIQPRERKEGYVPYSGTRCYLIFNPASSSRKLETSTPRAVTVRSAIFPADMIAELKKKSEPLIKLPEGMFTTVSIDETGAVTKVDPVALTEPRLTEAIVHAAKQWRFEPAKSGGSPIATTIRIPILFTWPDLFKDTDLTKHPRAIRQQKPVYPYSERAGGFRGEVVVDFTVTASGDVKDAEVRQSNNLNFNEPALEAVRAWKFEPGAVNGRPVNSRLRVPMIFDLEVDGVAARDRYEVSKAKSSTLPPVLQNDYPPKVKNVVQGVYPFEQLEKGAKATVSVRFVVQPSGKVMFVEQKDKPLTDFDRAARAMLQEFEFTPASKDGKPNWGMLKMDIEFNLRSEDVPVSPSARRILRELGKKDPAIFTVAQVEHKPEPVARHAPIFPEELLEANAGGEAMIEFFIDEEGQAQLPRIVSATKPPFGYAAAQAVSQWRFKPLTRAGKAVVVRARVPIVFAIPGGKTAPPEKASVPST